jgi:hypothetical protein
MAKKVKKGPKSSRKGERDRQPRAQRAAAHGPRPFVAGTTLQRAVLTIPFDSEAQLRRKLTRLLEALKRRPTTQPTAGLEAEAAPAMAEVAAGGCLDIVGATDVIIEALDGKPFEPQTKLDRVYLSQLERDLFRDRVFSAVEARGCSISLGDIPNSGGTKQIEVRDAVEESAR